MRVLFSATAAILACGLAITSAQALADTVTFSATGMDSSGSSEAVSINGSFVISAPPDSIHDPSSFDGVSDFTISFSPILGSVAGYPSATFTSATLPAILAPVTSGPYYSFDYNPFPMFMPGLFDIEADGTDGSGNYYGFFLQDEDGSGYEYGVGGTTYSGYLTNISVTDPGVPAPEPASMALFGMGLVGLAAARRRRAG